MRASLSGYVSCSQYFALHGMSDPYRRQGTLYIHTQQRPAVEEGATTTTTKKKVDSPNGTGELVVPISLSTTFRQEIPGQATAVGDFHSWGVGYEYARTGNPTRGALERALAQAEGGANYAVAFSSGSAAVSAVLQSILLLSSPTASAVASSPPQQQQQELHQGGVPLINGEGPPPFGVSDDHQPRRHHLLCIDDVYGGTQRYIRRILVPTHDVEAEFIDMSNPDQNKLPFRDNTRVRTTQFWGKDPICFGVTKMVSSSALIFLPEDGRLSSCNFAVDRKSVV